MGNVFYRAQKELDSKQQRGPFTVPPRSPLHHSFVEGNLQSAMIMIAFLRLEGPQRYLDDIEADAVAGSNLVWQS